MTENVEFHPIPNPSFTALVSQTTASEQRRFSLSHTPKAFGILQVNVDPNAIIGIGSFKTAHPGTLNLLHKPTDQHDKTGLFAVQPDRILGSTGLESVVVKRLYRQVHDQQRSETEAYSKGRFGGVDERQKLQIEGNVFMWAQSLMTFTMEATRRHQASNPSAHIKIPNLRFVLAGLALAHGLLETKAAPAAQTTTLRCVYLLEEPIVDESGQPEEFCKYIHNGSAIPLLDDNDDRYDLALFLAFTQHLQYEKTGNIAYISDYQGTY